MYEGPQGQVGAAYAVTFWVIVAVLIGLALFVTLR